jgi:hypothetical protein
LKASEPFVLYDEDEDSADDDAGGICRGGAFGLGGVGVAAGLLDFCIAVACRNGLLACAGVA